MASHDQSPQQQSTSSSPSPKDFPWAPSDPQAGVQNKASDHREYYGPRDVELYHLNPETDFDKHHSPQDEGPHVLRGPTTPSQGHPISNQGLSASVPVHTNTNFFRSKTRKRFWALLVLAVLVALGTTVGALCFAFL